MKGSELRATLENAIDRAWIRKTATGAFPYLAGARMFLDKSKPKGKRIVKLEVRNEENWIAISESITYRIVTHSFLANGGDYYKEFSNIKGYKEDLGFVDAEVFMWYIKERGGLSPLSNGDNCVITDIYEDEGDN
jgi:5'-nucleotidase